MKLKLNIFLFFFCLVAQGYAQEKGMPLTQNFRFRDGIYLSYEEFKKDTPSLKWEEIDAVMVQKPVEMVIQVEYFLEKTSGDTIRFEHIWGFSLDNIPFIRVEYEEANKEAFADFAAIKVRGKICYFRYEDKMEEVVSIYAYNPLTGQPFRRGSVTNTHEVTREKMMLFSKGEIVDLNKPNLLAFISDDESLWKSVSEVPETDQAKLYKSLLIYDDRNPVYFDH